MYTTSGIKFKYNHHRSECLTLVTFAESLRITLRFMLLLNNSTALSMVQNLSIITEIHFFPHSSQKGFLLCCNLHATVFWCTLAFSTLFWCGNHPGCLNVWQRLNAEELMQILGCRIVNISDRVHLFFRLKVLLRQLRNDDFAVAFSAELWLNVEHSHATITLPQQVSNMLTTICCHHNGRMFFYKMSDEHLCVLSRERPCWVYNVNIVLWNWLDLHSFWHRSMKEKFRINANIL